MDQDAATMNTESPAKTTTDVSQHEIEHHSAPLAVTDTKPKKNTAVANHKVHTHADASA